MKKWIVFLILLMIPMLVKANTIGEFKRSYNISLNCDKCDSSYEPSIEFQLFADGEELEGYRVVLNKDNNYKASFDNLDVFREGTSDEIKYEVKYLENGKFVSLKDDEVTYKKEKVSKWVQVKAEDLQVGHDYVFLTDNWNHDNNGKDPYILIDNNDQLVYHQYMGVKPEYNIINGKKSYYVLEGDPEERTIFRTSRVPEDAHHYDLYKDYWVLSSVESTKNLTLVGQQTGNGNYYYWKSSSRDGWMEDEHAKFTAKVAITPIEDEFGRFYISSECWWGEDHISKRYLGIGHSVEAVAQSEVEYGAHFIAFEYLDNVEVEQVYNVQISKVLCGAVEGEDNPYTGNKILKVTLILMSGACLMYIALRQVKFNRYKKEY